MPKSVVAAIPTVAGRVLTLMEFRSMGTQSVIVIEPYAGVETPTGHKSDAHFGSATEKYEYGMCLCRGSSKVK